MAGRTTKPKTVPGLTYQITITPLRNGKPWPGVEPLEFPWDQAILQWHQGHVDTGVMAALRTVEQRVRKHIQPRARGRR